MGEAVIGAAGARIYIICINICAHSHTGFLFQVRGSLDTSRDQVSFNGTGVVDSCSCPYNNIPPFSLDVDVCSYGPAQLQKMLEAQADQALEATGDPYNEVY